MPRNNWTREETIIAFNLYCKMPFSKAYSSNPRVIKFSKILERTPSALSMKLCNFARLDPELRKRGVVGLTNGSKMEEEIWKEFHGNWEELAYQSELLIAQFQQMSIEESSGISTESLPEGKEKERVVKTRVNQNFFRASILSSYDQKCCITGLSIPEVLVSSHIIPWSKNEKERLNPSNGLCLNALHDSAFDKGYISLSENFEVIISDYIKDHTEEDSVNDFFLKFEDRKISLPNKFLPKPEFLEFHRNNIFKK